MQYKISDILQAYNASSHTHHGVALCHMDAQKGLLFAKDLLYQVVDRTTCLFLSGGSTPKALYQEIAKEQELMPAAAGMVDERYGEPMHNASNELMLKQTGLLSYFKQANIPFYSILQKGLTREACADEYDHKVREIFASYKFQVAILGIGVDGHTAGLPALYTKRQTQNSKLADLYERSKNRMVIDYDDRDGFYKERITMTFLALSMIDFLLVLVFGENKKEALVKLFAEGSEEEIPSRFFKRPDISQKTLLITDQEV
jgi:6-phosphogluconolactonase/glucosamine-6-phosphate isomerase/deaminase